MTVVMVAGSLNGHQESISQLLYREGVNFGDRGATTIPGGFINKSLDNMCSSILRRLNDCNWFQIPPKLDVNDPRLMNYVRAPQHLIDHFRENDPEAPAIGVENPQLTIVGPYFEVNLEEDVKWIFSIRHEEEVARLLYEKHGAQGFPPEKGKVIAENYMNFLAAWIGHVDAKVVTPEILGFDTYRSEHDAFNHLKDDYGVSSLEELLEWLDIKTVTTNMDEIAKPIVIQKNMVPS